MMHISLIPTCLKMWIDNLKKSISCAHHQTIIDDRSSDVVPGPTTTGGWDDSDNEDEDKIEGGAAKGSRTTRTAKQILLIPGLRICVHVSLCCMHFLKELLIFHTVYFF